MEKIKVDGYIGRDGDYFSLAKLDAQLAALPTGTTDLTIEINSGGGSVIEGTAMYDRLKTLSLNLYTKIIGQCSSIATLLSLAAKKENRSISPNAEYGVHFPYWEPDRAEAFEAEDLINLGNSLMESKKRILKIYAKETGTSETVLYSLMEQERSLTAAEAIKYGFVSTVTSEKVDAQKYRIAAFMEKTPKTKDMDFTASQKSSLETMFTGLLKKFDNLFTPVFKNMLIELGNGGKIWVDSEDEDLAGKKVFNVDADGNKTNEVTPDGEYVTKDGKTIVVKDGAVSEVKEAAAATEETAALKKQVADLTAELATANTKAQTAEAAKAQAETAKAETETKVQALAKEVTDFKAMLLGKDIPPAGQEFKGAKPEVADANQKWLELKRAEKAKKEASTKK